jgi:hypothetical protein
LHLKSSRDSVKEIFPEINFEFSTSIRNTKERLPTLSSFGRLGTETDFSFYIALISDSRSRFFLESPQVSFDDVQRVELIFYNAVPRESNRDCVVL